jgi:hypothetical protein
VFTNRYYILNIVAVCLYNCSVIAGHDYNTLATAYMILHEIGEVFILAIILVIVAPRFHNFPVTKCPKLLCFGLVGLTILAAVAAIGYVVAYCYYIYTDDSAVIYVVGGWETGFYMIYWIAATIASIILVFSLMKLKGNQARKVSFGRA